MQISSSVSSVCLSLSQGKRTVKNSGEYGLRESLEPDKISKSLDIEERLNYKKPYSAWMEQRIKCIAPQTKTDESEDGTGDVLRAEYEEEGEFLGITMIPEEGKHVIYGMRAVLLQRSGSDGPIVQVVSNLGGKEEIYHVDISKVNPQKATQLEMFALLSYADKMELIDGGSFGAYQQLEVYAMNASHNGYCDSLMGGDIFIDRNFDWSDIIEKIMRDYLESGIDKQYDACKRLLDFFESIKKI